MSTSDQSGGDPDPLFHYFDANLPEHDVFAAEGHHIPADPLLKSGTFIEADLGPTGPTPTGSQPAQNGVSEPNPYEDPEPVSEGPELRASPVAGGSNGTGGMTTASTDGAESTPVRRKEPQQVPVPERPHWLPEGWRIDYRVRTSGASAGSVDRYYFEPVSGRKFRSKKEVDYFLETGSARKKIRNVDADVNSPEKSGSKKKRFAPLNFDFNDVPEKVRWVLTDAAKDQWTPFLADKVIPKSTRQEWNAAFHFSCS